MLAQNNMAVRLKVFLFFPESREDRKLLCRSAFLLVFVAAFFDVFDVVVVVGLLFFFFLATVIKKPG